MDDKGRITAPEWTAFAHERGEAAAQAVREALTGADGMVGCPFVLLLPVADGCIQHSNMTPAEALEVQGRNVTQATIRAITEALQSGNVTVMTVGPMPPDDEPEGKVH